jgi:hypothetical protein
MRALWMLIGLALLVGCGFGVWQWREVGRQAIYVIPPGAVSEQGSGEHAPVLPETITLTLGVRDTLVIRNEDSAPVEVGGIVIGPGQQYTQRYHNAGTFDLVCTLHVSERMRVIVQRLG